MENFVEKGSSVIKDAAEKIKKAAEALAAPEVFPLNRRSTLNMCAAVAVDAGQSLFSGVLRDMGIGVFQVASSREDEEVKTYSFWVAPNLPDEERKRVIQENIDRLIAEDALLTRFVEAMGWRKVHDEGVMPPACYSSAAALGDFLRELLEWSMLFDLGKKLKTVEGLGTGIQPVLLRDGTLRFDSMGEDHTGRLKKNFQTIDVPLLGVTKHSALLKNPVVTLWLSLHGVFKREGALVVKLERETFEELGWRLGRYFGGEDNAIRFGQYSLVRFDPMPSSRNLFAVDIPTYLMGDWDKVLVLLSGIKEHATATAYPVPGYPVALRKAHERVVLTADRVRLLENSIRRSIPPEIYDFLKSLGL